MPTRIEKMKLEDIKSGFLQESTNEALNFAETLSRKAKAAGMAMDQYLDMAVDLSEGKGAELKALGLGGYEAVNCALELPIQTDRKGQISLAAASETFATKPATRILMPYTVDNVLRWSSRIDSMERVEDMITSSRTITGVELVRSIITEEGDDATKTHIVGEGGRIPVRKVTTGTKAVEIFKHGSGLEFSYEFERRAALDLITPYASRIERDLQISKMAALTALMIKGDGINPAATVLSQATLDTAATDGKMSYDGILAAVASAAKKHVIIDTIAGDIDAYMQFVKLFGTAAASSAFEVDQKAEKGAPQFAMMRNIFAPIKFVLNSHVPAGKVLMFNRADTAEEIVEAGSRIAEEERAIRNQVVTYTKTENTGYGIIYGDTRFLYTYNTKA